MLDSYGERRNDAGPGGDLMPFVKLDCGILDSTLWAEKDGRDVFLTALLMATPHEVKEPMPQIEVRTLKLTGWEVPAGWYGLVAAAGLGIIIRAQVEREAGMAALEALGSPEPDSRSHDFEGRRLVRVDGGYVVLNFMRYRDYDYGAAGRMKLLRQRKKAKKDAATVTPNDATVRPNSDGDTSHRDGGREQRAEAEAENGNGSSSGHDRRPAKERKNLLIDRNALEMESMRLDREIAALAKLDPTTVQLTASKYKGTTAANCASQNDDWLVQTVEAKRRWKRKLTGEPEPEVPRSAEPEYVSPKAQAREDAANAELRGGIRGDGSLLDGRVREDARLPAGQGTDGSDARGPRPSLQRADREPTER